MHIRFFSFFFLQTPPIQRVKVFSSIFFYTKFVTLLVTIAIYFSSKINNGIFFFYLFVLYFFSTYSFFTLSCFSCPNSPFLYTQNIPPITQPRFSPDNFPSSSFCCVSTRIRRYVTQFSQPSRKLKSICR